MSKSGHRAINYSASPLLASKTPVWRSKFVVALLALAFAGLGARAAYVQVFGNEFFQRQGEVRFARTLELPANRGRVLDRNGLILASSVVAQSIWAIPEDVDKSEPKLKDLAKLLEMPLSALRKKLANEDKTFVWIKRQVDEPIAKEIAALGIKGIYQRREYKRQYPEGEAAAHVVGFTNVEDRGQEGVELAFNSQLAGKAGSRRVIKDRLGRVIEDVRDVIPPVDGPDLQLSIDSKVQFFAYEKLREAVKENKAKAGSVIVLDAQTGEVLALANFPSYNPNKRVNLSGEQLRNRVLTDSFEPGSTMKPFIAALALEKGLVRPTTQIQTAPGRVTIGGSTISDAHPHEVLTVNEIIQKSSNVGTVKMAMQMHPREMWETYAQAGFGQKPQVPFPGAVSGRPAAVQDLAPHRTGHHELRLRPVGVAVPAGAGLHDLRPQRRADPGEHAQDRGPRHRRAGVQREERGGGAQDAGAGHRPRRHCAQGTDHGLFGGRQNRHGPQAGGQGLRRQQVPQLVRGHRAH